MTLKKAGADVGSPVILVPGSTVLMDADAVATVSFKRTAKKYDLTFIAEGEGAADFKYYDKDKREITKPSEYTVKKETVLPTVSRSGYEFLGWTETMDSDDDDYITVITEDDYGDKTFYAKWNRIEQFKLIVNSQGHYGASFEPQTGIAEIQMTPALVNGCVTENAAYTFRAKLKSDDNSYMFMGWYLNQSTVPVSSTKCSVSDDGYSVLAYEFTENDVVRDSDGNNPQVTLVARYQYTGDAHGVKLYIFGDDGFNVEIIEDDAANPTTVAATPKSVGLSTVYEYEGSIKPLSVITLKYTGTRIPEWRNDIGIVTSDSKDFCLNQVIIAKNYQLVTVAPGDGTEEPLSYFVEARNENQVLASKEISSLDELTEWLSTVKKPSRFGKEFDDWYLPTGAALGDLTAANFARRLNKAITEGTANRVVFHPEFKDLPPEEVKTAEITVIEVLESKNPSSPVTKFTTTKTYNIGELVPLEAKTYSDLYFNGWYRDVNGDGEINIYDGDKRLSQSANYKLSVIGDRTVYAIYGFTKDTFEFPSVEVTGTVAENVSGTRKIGFQMTWAVPANYTLINHGILRIPEASFPAAVTSAGDREGYLKFIEDPETGNVTIPANVKNPDITGAGQNNGLNYHLSVGANQSATVYMRGYITYTDSYGQHIKYTDVYVMSWDYLNQHNNQPESVIPTSTPDPVPEQDVEDDW